MTPPNRPIILILGPTASGKTELAIALAQQLPGGGECICADSMQVYRGMDIGTAKPTVAEQAAAPHHVIDVADPADDDFSVDRWLELAEQAIMDIRSRGTWPIVVGGTNLYIQSLLFGLFDGPPPDAERRARLNAMPLSELRLWLERIDPEAAARIHPNDRKRTVRAIEVHEATGRPISEQQTQWTPERMRSDVLIIGLDVPVEAINRRINARVKAMVEAGLFDEVRALHEAGRLGRQAAEALGYKQVIDHLEGRLSAEDAVEQIKIRTRRFAKQQRTWLRRFRSLAGLTWIEASEKSTQDIANQALTHISSHAVALPEPYRNPGSS
jgi:tRNA dimethylallyltransferase